ncbi:MAG: O-sialoglycoprotein endopeptidase [Clostridiales bacterium]|nr:O-sialoglycoprotein endopeptidase [Clostridiales bacterium]
MQTKDYVLGIDTSNYTTSAAVVCETGEIIHDLRKSLIVKQGERGLRQSHALFQHVEALPALIEQAMGGNNIRFKAVAVSTRPRPLDSSYMPVFKAGENFAMTIAHALNIPVFKFSHQEGHIEAVKHDGSLQEKERFLCYHLSGGTCEILKVNGDRIDILGGTKDISFGQVIDRLGVLLGMSFPCGAELDSIALKTVGQSQFLSSIPLDGLMINLSGMEAQTTRVTESEPGIDERDMLIKEMFNNIANALIKMTEKAVLQTGLSDVLFTGGVSASKFVSGMLYEHFDGSDVNIAFGKQHLSSDNAVGIALLGMREMRKHRWQ